MKKKIIILLSVVTVSYTHLDVYKRQFALFCLISVQAERTFERLRYSLGGDRPSQTAHLTMSPSLIQRRRLEFQYRKDGIPTATPQDVYKRQIY